jgi:transposase
MNTKLHAVTDANGPPLSFFMTAGQVSDYTGAAALLDDLPKAQWLLGDRGLRRRLVQGCLAGQGYPAVHPNSEVPA